MCWGFFTLVFLNKEIFLFGAGGKPINEADLNGFRNTGLSVSFVFCLISLLVPSVNDGPLSSPLTPFL